MSTITRTVMSGIEHLTYVSLDGVSVVPECITRYGSGTRVEVRKINGKKYAVQPLASDPRRIFGEETWLAVV